MKKKIITTIAIVATIILAGVTVYTAIRLYQLRAKPVAPNVPESKPAAAGITTPTPVAPILCELDFAIPSPTPKPTPSPSPTPKPTATPSTKPSPTPTKSPSPTPKPTATPTKSPSPTPKPTASPTVKPTATPTIKPTATPTKSPSPTPTIAPVAQCQNITAYSSTWTVMTAQQLSALKTGNVINICVVGSASAGIFDKAMFTINGTQQSETIAKRPNTQDFCQSYTIPANTYSFDISAQIHHATLGWK